MIVSALPSLVEFCINWLNANLGTNLSTTYATHIAYGLICPFFLLAIYAYIRRKRVTLQRLFKKDVLDDDGQAVVSHIKDDLDKMQGDIRKALKNQKPNAELSQILEMLQDRLEVTKGLVENKADETDDANEATDQPRQLDRFGRIPKRQMIRLVREKVLSNLWNGYLSESRQADLNRDKRHIFHASLTDAEGERVTVTARTPYSGMRKAELPYAIDVRHGSRTVMRIQWDPATQDDIKDQYTIRGVWEDAILSWNPKPPSVPKAAAEPMVIIKGRQIKPEPAQDSEDRPAAN